MGRSVVAASVPGDANAADPLEHFLRIGGLLPALPASSTEAAAPTGDATK
jgi:hypothetical protein